MTADGTLELEDMHIELPDVSIGGVGMEDLQLDFFRDEDGDSVWRGQGNAVLRPGLRGRGRRTGRRRPAASRSATASSSARS